jgi:succinyl-diaminopimelate desuccinylase
VQGGALARDRRANVIAIDPVTLAQTLIKRPSVTPRDEGVLGVLEAALEPMGFRCERMPFSEPGTPDVDNLYARRGTGGPHFCFAGHSDVVPVGRSQRLDRRALCRRGA